MKRQVDYNKIATNISKYSFSFDLTVKETYENFSKEYQEIYTIFSLLKTTLVNFNENIAIDNPAPFFIQDNASSTGSYLVNDVLLTQQNNILTITGIQTDNNLNNIVNFEYNFNEDKLVVNTTQEEFLTEDNVKSVFNQTITGTGNITLFRHIITITTSSQDFILLEYISSNNLKVDSVQDLRTLCGNNFTLPVEGVHQVGQDIFSKVLKLVGTNTTLDYTTIKSDGTLQTLSALSGSLSDVVTTI